MKIQPKPVLPILALFAAISLACNAFAAPVYTAQSVGGGSGPNRTYSNMATTGSTEWSVSGASDNCSRYVAGNVCMTYVKGTNNHNYEIELSLSLLPVNYDYRTLKYPKDTYFMISASAGSACLGNVSAYTFPGPLAETGSITPPSSCNIALHVLPPVRPDLRGGGGVAAVQAWLSSPPFVVKVPAGYSWQIAIGYPPGTPMYDITGLDSQFKILH